MCKRPTVTGTLIGDSDSDAVFESEMVIFIGAVDKNEGSPLGNVGCELCVGEGWKAETGMGVLNEDVGTMTGRDALDLCGSTP